MPYGSFSFNVVAGTDISTNVGFNPLGVIVSNYSPYYIYFPDGLTFFPPWTSSAVFPLAHATQARATWGQTPFGPQVVATGGVQYTASITFSDSPDLALAGGTLITAPVKYGQTFAASGSFIVPIGTKTLTILAVGGGGNGGNATGVGGGGGGGGGQVVNTSAVVTDGIPLTVTIGGANTNTIVVGPGVNITALAGGNGGSNTAGGTGYNGGGAGAANPGRGGGGGGSLTAAGVSSGNAAGAAGGVATGGNIGGKASTNNIGGGNGGTETTGYGGGGGGGRINGGGTGGR